MTHAFSMTLEAAGIIALVVGYRYSSRNWMTIGAAVLWLGASLGGLAPSLLSGLMASAKH